MSSATNKTDWLARFTSDGYVALPEFISGEQIQELVLQIDQFIETVVPNLPPEQVFYEDKTIPATLKQIQHMEDHGLRFHELLDRGKIRGIAELLLRGPVVPKNMQYFSKPAGTGKPTPPHQDGFYFMLDPCEAVTLWLALDEVDQENGCVHYVRGSHRFGLRDHRRTQTLGFSQGIADFPSQNDSENTIAVPAKPGDLLAHDAMTIHFAGSNHSTTRTRRALGFIYYSERAREDTEAHAAYQRRLTEDWKADGKI
jgi:phytanoyl-CoA hydroxylase